MNWLKNIINKFSNIFFSSPFRKRVYVKQKIAIYSTNNCYVCLFSGKKLGHKNSINILLQFYYTEHD